MVKKLAKEDPSEDIKEIASKNEFKWIFFHFK